MEAIAAAGFADIQIAHFKVLGFPPPENERPIALAQRAGMSRQAMNYLLLHVQRVEMGGIVCAPCLLDRERLEEWERQIGAALPDVL